MSCKKCNKDLKIVNKFHNLCLICNNRRLEDNKKSKVDKEVKKKKESRIAKENRLIHKVKEGIKDRELKVFGGRRQGKTFLQDELFYEICFNSSNHKCEECGDSLPDEFRDEEGKVIARHRYSHIVAKSIAPELRYSIDNINHLCLPCHMIWDFGDRKSMKIYEENKKKFPEYLK